MKLTDIAKNKPILEARKPMSVETAGEENMAQAKAMRPQFTDKQIKMAFGILNDPRYKDGNYDGAHATIEKLAKGLSQHPSVANAMKRANEDIVTEGSYLYLNGKEIDQSTVIYDMQDYSDGMFELHGANYADGTELDEKELEELESTQELIDWVMIDFVEEGRSNENVQPILHPNVQQQRKDDMYNAQAGVKKSSGNKKPGLQGKELADYRAKRVAEYEADLVKKRAENAARLKSYGEGYKKLPERGERAKKNKKVKEGGSYEDTLFAKLAEANSKKKVAKCSECGNPSYTTLDEETSKKKKGSHGKVCWKGYRRGKGDSCHKVKGDA